MGSEGEWHYSFILKDLPQDLIEFCEKLDEYHNYVDHNGIDLDELELPSYEFFQKYKHDWYKALTGEYFKFTVQGYMGFESGYSFLMCVREDGKEAQGMNFEKDFLEMLQPHIVNGAFIHWGEYYSGSCSNTYQIVYPEVLDGEEN